MPNYLSSTYKPATWAGTPEEFGASLTQDMGVAGQPGSVYHHDGGGWVIQPAAGANGGAAGTTATSSPATPFGFAPTSAPGFTAPARTGAPGGVPTLATGTVANPTLGAAPGYSGPANFSYAAFQAPTADTLAQDPGYQFRLQQGTQQLTNAASANGTLRGGAQQRALQSYGQQEAATEYANAFKRAGDVYATNYGVAKDTYDKAYTASRDTYTRGLNERDSQYAADTDVYGRERQGRMDTYGAAGEGWDRSGQERNADYQARMAGAAAEYDPSMLTWQAKNLAGSREAELNFERDWQRETYRTDDAYRKARDRDDNAYRWGSLTTGDNWNRYSYAGDDAWRRYRAEIEDKQWLATPRDY